MSEPEIFMKEGNANGGVVAFWGRSKREIPFRWIPYEPDGICDVLGSAAVRQSSGAFASRGRSKAAEDCRTPRRWRDLARVLDRR